MAIFGRLSIFKNKFSKEIFWSFSSKVITFLLFFLLNIYLARTLGTERFGSWAFFLSIFKIIFVISLFGINASTNKFVAQYNKMKELSNVIKSSVKLRIIFSLLFAILVFLIHKPLAILSGRSEFTSLFMFSALLILFAGLVEFLKAVFIGLHRIKYHFISNLSEHSIKLLLVILFLNFSSKLIGILNSFVIARFIASIIGFYCLYKNFYIKNHIDEKKDFTKDILNYSIPLFFIGIGSLLIMEIDTLMLGFLSTPQEVGIYAVAKQTIIKLPHISVLIAMGTMPVFAKLNKDNKERLKNIFYQLLKINALIFLLLTIVILSFSNFFIPIIFGTEYRGAVLPLQILTVYLVSASFLVFIDLFLDYQGLAKKRAVNLSFSIILNIALNFLLIPKYGAMGAAIATSISYIPYLILNWFEVKRVIKKV